MKLKHVSFTFTSSLSDSLVDTVVIDIARRKVIVTIGNNAPIEHRPVSLPFVHTKQAQDFLNAAYQGELI